MSYKDDLTEKTLPLELNSWNVSFDTENPAVMNVDAEGDRILELKPNIFGATNEDSAMITKHRTHDSLELQSYRVEFDSIIPFGAEPKISRSVELFANHGKVTSDIFLRKGFAMERLSVDPLFLPGQWKEVALIKKPEDSTSLPEPEWHSIEAASDVIFDTSVPFVIMILRRENGLELEIGTGDDFWRWADTSSPCESIENVSSSFRLEKRDDGLMLFRDLYILPQETAISETKNRRFKWYFAWSSDKQIPSESSSQDNFDYQNYNWSKQASAITLDGKGTDVCMASAPARKVMKKHLRASAGNPACRDVAIGIVNIEPHFCFSAAHLGRSGKGALPHWDMMNIMDFYLWANRQLAKNNSSITLHAQPDSPLKQIPSIKGLGEVLKK